MRSYTFLLFLYFPYLFRFECRILPSRTVFIGRSSPWIDIGHFSSVNSTLVSILAARSSVSEKLTFTQTMTAGAVSRTFAQTIMHPANTFKTMLQLKRTGAPLDLSPSRLLRGADAQFIMSLPHGAFYFYVIDAVKRHISPFLPQHMYFVGDFLSSTISTIICSVVSTPQMVITDRLMAGMYPSFPSALSNIFKSEGLRGFYTGWWPALAQKIPSYGLTWMFFQEFKRMHEFYFGSEPNPEMNFGLGAIAAAAAVCVMNPVDTIKTRLVTQVASPTAYKGMRDCFLRMIREEGVGSFYLSLTPRLMAVVPMIAIQFGVYELLQKQFERLNLEKRISEVAKNRARQFRTSVAKARERRIAKKMLLGLPRTINSLLKKSPSKDGSDELNEDESVDVDRSSQKSRRRTTLQSTNPVLVGSIYDNQFRNSNTLDQDTEILEEDKLVSWFESKFNLLNAYRSRVVPPAAIFPIQIGARL